MHTVGDSPLSDLRICAGAQVFGCDGKHWKRYRSNLAAAFAR